MPTYTFENTDNGNRENITMRISKLSDYKKNNPHMKQILGTFGISDPIRMGLRKPDDGFRDRLKDIKKAHKGSTINTW